MWCEGGKKGFLFFFANRFFSISISFRFHSRCLVAIFIMLELLSLWVLIDFPLTMLAHAREEKFNPANKKRNLKMNFLSRINFSNYPSRATSVGLLAFSSVCTRKFNLYEFASAAKKESSRREDSSYPIYIHFQILKTLNRHSIIFQLCSTREKKMKSDFFKSDMIIIWNWNRMLKILLHVSVFFQHCTICKSEISSM